MNGSSYYAYGVTASLSKILNGPSRPFFREVARKIDIQHAAERQKVREENPEASLFTLDYLYNGTDTGCWADFHKSMIDDFGEYSDEDLLTAMEECGDSLVHETFFFYAMEKQKHVDIYYDVVSSDHEDAVQIFIEDSLLNLEWKRISEATEPSDEAKEELRDLLDSFGLEDVEPGWDNFYIED